MNLNDDVSLLLVCFMTLSIVAFNNLSNLSLRVFVVASAALSLNLINDRSLLFLMRLKLIELLFLFIANVFNSHTAMAGAIIDLLLVFYFVVKIFVTTI